MEATRGSDRNATRSDSLIKSTPQVTSGKAYREPCSDEPAEATFPVHLVSINFGMRDSLFARVHRGPQRWKLVRYNRTLYRPPLHFA